MLIDENGWLHDFLRKTLTSLEGNDPLTCENLNQIFFASSGSCPVNRLRAIYNALANEDHPDFVIMSKFLNGMAKNLVSSRF